MKYSIKKRVIVNIINYISIYKEGDFIKVSVVMSTYNGENYIYEQLESLYLQTRQANEVLIYDDCSTDNTVKIIQEYIECNNIKSWKLIVNEKNKGWRKNFIDGINSAVGDIIFPCDQDDIWNKNKIESMERIMEENLKIGLLTSNCKAFYDNGTTKILPAFENGKVIKHNIKHRIFRIDYPGCTYCIRNDLAKKACKYWDEGIPHDAWLWMISMYSDNLYSYNKSMIRWRRHNDSSYTKESIKGKNIESKREWTINAIKRLEILKKFLIENNVENLEKKLKSIDNNMNWLKTRNEFLANKKMIYGIKLIRFIIHYSKIRQYIGDWYLVYIKKN